MVLIHGIKTLVLANVLFPTPRSPPREKNKHKHTNIELTVLQESYLRDVGMFSTLLNSLCLQYINYWDRFGVVFICLHTVLPDLLITAFTGMRKFALWAKGTSLSLFCLLSWLPFFLWAIISCLKKQRVGFCCVTLKLFHLLCLDIAHLWRRPGFCANFVFVRKLSQTVYFSGCNASRRLRGYSGLCDRMQVLLLSGLKEACFLELALAFEGLSRATLS